MPPAWVAFDGWTPGAGYFGGEGSGWETVRNLIPYYSSWRPLRAFAPAAGSVVDGPMTGAFAHLWMSGLGTGAYLPDAATLYTGSPTKLYTVDPTTGAFTDASRAANYGATVPAG